MQSIFIAECIGTMILIILGQGVVENVVLKGTKGNHSGWMVITTGWAFGVFAGVLVAGPYSGAHLNPAVTLALCIAGKVGWAKFIPYVAGQMIGAMLGSFMVWLMYKDHFDATESEEDKLGCFSTIPAIKNIPLNLWSEILGTFVLVFSVFYITDASINTGVATGTKIGLGSVGALPVSIMVWVIGLSLGGTTGYAINPARDLGPRIVHALLPFKGSSQWDYAWVPVVGPMLGGMIAAGLFLIL